MKTKYKKKDDQLKFSPDKLIPKSKCDITLYPFYDEDWQKAQTLCEKNRKKWTDKPESWQKRMQMGRTAAAFWQLVIQARIFKTKHDNIDEFYESLIRNVDPLICEIFSKHEYNQTEMDFIESRMTVYYNSGAIDLSDPTILFMMRQLIDTELLVTKWQRRLRNTEDTVVINRLQNVLQKGLESCSDIKSEIGLKTPSLTKAEQKAKEKEAKQDDEHKKYSSAISDIIKENQEAKDKLARKIATMKENKEKRDGNV